MSQKHVSFIDKSIFCYYCLHICKAQRLLLKKNKTVKVIKSLLYSL